MRTGLAEKLQKLRKTAAIKFIVDAVAPPPRANRPKYRRRLVPATLSPESSLCSRSKTAYACLKLRFVLDAFSYSPASLCTFLRSVSFVLPAIFIAETSCPILRFRVFAGARHLITSSSIQAFPRRLTLSESSRIKLFLDLAGHRRRKQGFNSHRIQVVYHQVLTYIIETKGNNISIVVR